MPSGVGQRLTFVDALRGFALFGVFAANLFIFSGYTFLTDEQKAEVATTEADTLFYRGELFFIENKFMGLFSFLFGVSFWLFLERVQQREPSGLLRFYRRIAWLLAIGLLHGWLFWCFDILRFYALWALLLPLFLRLPPRRLVIVAFAAAVFVPAVVAGLRGILPSAAPPPGPTIDSLALAAFSRGDYAAVLRMNWLYDWYLTLSVGQIAYQIAVFGRLLLGLWVARTWSLSDLRAHRPALIRTAIVGSLFGLAGNWVFAFDLLGGERGFAVHFFRRFLMEAGFLGLTLAMAAALALLFLRPAGSRLLSVLAPLGQVALTAYLTQTLFGLWLFYGFMPGPGLMGNVGPTLLVGIAVAGYALQVALAHVWMKRYRYGPAEWIWRSLTYGRRQPLRLQSSG